MRHLVVLLLLTLAIGCTSAGGMLRVQAGLWRDGGIAHLKRTAPGPLGVDASADELAAFNDWRAALEVAANTVCTEDQRQKLKNTSACKCAEAALAAIECMDFLAGRP